MNKNLVIGAVIAVLALGVGGYLVVKGRTSGGQGTISPVQTSQSAPKSLKDLLGLGTAQKCTYPGGTVFVAGGKVRGDFSSTTDGKTVISHMIVDGKTSYTWMDGEKGGFKFAFDQNAQSATTSPSGSSGAVDASKPEDYKCEGWVADSSLFDLPTGVTFTDMSSFVNPSVAPQASGASSSQCSYCDSLSGSDKTQCLTALNCK